MAIDCLIYKHTTKLTHFCGGNVQSDRGGGGGTHRGGGEVQVPWKAAGPFRRRLTSSPAQHQEGKAGVGGIRKLLRREGAELAFPEKNYRVVVQVVLLFGA